MPVCTPETKPELPRPKIRIERANMALVGWKTLPHVIISQTIAEVAETAQMSFALMWL